MRRPHGERAGTALASALFVALSSGCGGGADTPAGSSGSTSPDGPTASATPSGDPSHRPEGAWTLAAWTVERSDGKSNPQARILLATLTPGCPAGSCDITFAPAGADGTYREAEAPAGADGQPATAPITLTWSGTAYVGSDPPRVVDCLPTGQVSNTIADGYSTKRTVTLTFDPPAGDLPPHVHGTIVDTTTGTKAAKAKGCTDFVETAAVGGSPTGSLDAGLPLVGEYDASLSSTGSTPKKLAPVGQSLWLGQMVVKGEPKAPTIRGLTAGVAPLAQAASGWDGTSTVAPFDCQDPRGQASPKGADAIETYSALHPVALTQDGKTIFAGEWTLRANPNATGLKAACSLAAYEGRLYLVPHGAGG